LTATSGTAVGVAAKVATAFACAFSSTAIGSVMSMLGLGAARPNHSSQTCSKITTESKTLAQKD
jgi:hypothetical protein